MNMNKIILPLAAVSAFAMSNVALAANPETGNAKVLIVTALGVTETAEIDFGTITNEDGVCTMSSAGVVTNDGNQACSSSGNTIGSFDVTGTDDASVAITLTKSAAVGGVDYAPLLSSNDLTTGTITLSNTGTATVTVIGSITMTSATDGQRNIPYTFTANYN